MWLDVVSTDYYFTCLSILEILYTHAYHWFASCKNLLQHDSWRYASYMIYDGFLFQVHHTSFQYCSLNKMKAENIIMYHAMQLKWKNNLRYAAISER